MITGVNIFKRPHISVSVFLHYFVLQSSAASPQGRSTLCVLLQLICKTKDSALHIPNFGLFKTLQLFLGTLNFCFVFEFRIWGYMGVIANSSSCTTAEFSKLLTSCLIAIKKNM